MAASKKVKDAKKFLESRGCGFGRQVGRDMAGGAVGGRGCGWQSWAAWWSILEILITESPANIELLWT